MKRKDHGWYRPLSKRKSYTKTLLIMKLMLFFLVGCLQLHASISAQRVSLNLKDAALTTVFKEIQKQSGYQFLYPDELLTSGKQITILARNRSIAEILDECLHPKGLDYVIDDEVGKTIVIRRAEYQSDATAKPEKNVVLIRGTITDENGQPVSGASVLVKGTNIGTSSDASGNFRLDVEQNNIVLVVSSIGFETVELEVSGTAPVAIVLKTKEDVIDDVVVIGFGTQKKVDVTGAISVVTAEQVNQGVNQSVSHALQGRAAGVTVLQNSAEPGAGVAMRIRGAGTLNDNNPLYVVDGIIGSIDGLNPADVENISVLKDAASAAIYGSRGANGVIIVTTKKGKRDQKTVVSFNTSQGLQQVWKMPTSLTAEQRNLIHKEALVNDNVPSSEPIWNYYNDPDNAVTRTDWFREVLRTAYTSSSDLAIRGGSQRSNYSFSLGFLNNDGTVRESNYRRYNIRFNSEHELARNLSFGENIYVVVNHRKAVDIRPSWNGVLSSALFNMRDIPVYENEAELIYGNPVGEFPNPVASLKNRDNRNRNATIGGNAYLQYRFFKFLTVKTDFAYTYGFNRNKNFTAMAKNGGRGLSENSLNEYYSTSNSWIWNNTLNFENRFGDHYITALAGTSAESGITEWLSTGTAKNFSNQDEPLRYFNNAGNFPDNPTGSADDYALQGYFGRVTYAYADKYLLAANLRRDGSSKFSSAERWGWFPSISAGWRLSNEKFFGNLLNVISDLKIRGSWGRLGNDKIPNYQFYSTISPVSAPTLNNAIFTSVAQNKLANPNIKWEVTTQTDVGIDLSILQNRLTFTADYFDKQTSDILVRVPLISSLGVGEAPFRNAGNVSNKGYEISLTYRDQNGKLGYEVTGNFSQVKNKLETFGIAGATDIFLSDYKNINVGRFAEGEPLGHFYVLRSLGIFQTQEEINNHVDKNGALLQPNAVPGDLKFDDVNGDGAISVNDRINAGNSFPTFSYSLSASLNYGGFDMNMLWVGTEGNKIFNGLTLGGKLMHGTTYNNGPDILDRWTPESRNTTIPRVTVRDLNNNRAYSTFFIEDGSYLRLKYLTIGYSFREKITGKSISKLRAFLTLQNLITITRYSGFDPEVGTDVDYNGNMYGVDRGTYPQARTYILGINLNF